jgi:hypothetical protein
MDASTPKLGAQAGTSQNGTKNGTKNGNGNGTKNGNGNTASSATAATNGSNTAMLSARNSTQINAPTHFSATTGQFSTPNGTPAHAPPPGITARQAEANAPQINDARPSGGSASPADTSGQQTRT